VRPRDRVHVSVGGCLPRCDQTEQRHFLEHAQFHHDPDGRLRLRAQERRTGLQKVDSLCALVYQRSTLNAQRPVRTVERCTLGAGRWHQLTDERLTPDYWLWSAAIAAYVAVERLSLAIHYDGWTPDFR